MQIITNQNQKEIKEHGNYSFPVLVSYEALSNYESGSFLWHWHPEIEITLVTHGEMLYHINHDTFHLKEGQILFWELQRSALRTALPPYGLQLYFHYL